MKAKNRCFIHIANLVKKYRSLSSQSLSQVDLSHHLGYKNGQFISNVERGVCAIPLKALGDLKDILQIPQEELLEAMVLDYQMTIMNHLNDESRRKKAFSK